MIPMDILPLKLTVLKPQTYSKATWVGFGILFDPNDEHAGPGFSAKKAEMDLMLIDWCRENVHEILTNGNKAFRMDIMWSGYSKFFFKSPKDAALFKLRWSS